jgi:hypothetical protein
MRTLREEAKLILKRPIFLAWAFSILATSGGTISSIYFSKQRQLQSTLTISLETVRSALNAGDWDMALAHLKVTSKTAKLFNLYTGSHDGQHMKTTLAGPVGEQPWGLIQFCGETQQGNYGPLVFVNVLLDLFEVEMPKERTEMPVDHGFVVPGA